MEQVLIIMLSFISTSHSTLLNWGNTGTIPDEFTSPICGYDPTNNNIYILQFGYPLQSFNIINKSFSDPSSSIINGNGHRIADIKNIYSQAFTTINNTIYYANGKKTIGSFNMDTLKMSRSITITPQLYYGDKSCITSSLDGRYLFILGGTTIQTVSIYMTNMTNTFQIYDFHQNIWYNGPNMTLPRIQFSCNVLSNGYLYAIGGVWDDYYVTDTVEKIDISNISELIRDKSWSWKQLSAKLTKTLRWHSSVVYRNNTIYIMGGDDGNENTNVVNKIDGNTDKIYLDESMPVPAAGQCAVSTHDYGIFVMGGNTYKGTVYKHAEITENYDIINPLSNMTIIFNKSSHALPQPNMYMACGHYRDNIYILGGQADPYQILQYDLVEKQYNPIHALINPNQTQPGITCLGQCYVSYDDILYYLHDFDIYSFNMSSHEMLLLSQDFNLISIGEYACLTISDNGEYLFILGGQSDIDPGHGLNTFQIYDIIDETIHNGPNMIYDRSALTCNVHNGHLFAIGGTRGGKGTVGSKYWGTAMSETIDISDLNQNQSWNLLSPIASTAVQFRSIVFNGYVMTFGGQFGTDGPHQDINIIDHYTNNLVFYSKSLELPVKLYGHCMVNVEDNDNDRSSFYVFGGTTKTTNEIEDFTVLVNSVYIGSAIPSNSGDDNTLIMNYLVYILGATMFILFIIIIISMSICMCRKRIHIKNAMVIGIVIRDYNIRVSDEEESEEKEDSLMNDGFNDLNGIEIDTENIKKFATFLNYTMAAVPMENEKHPWKWNGEQIDDYLHDMANKFENGINKYGYDGLIVFISSHGVKGHIVASDRDRIEFERIHRIFTNTHAKTREIPRIFVYDCCQGQQESPKNESKAKSGTDSPAPKIWEASALINEDEQIWKDKENHCDYKKVEICATTSEFVSKLDKENGSYFITTFIRKVIKDNSKYLGQICDEIQDAFHERKYQLTESKYNNGTRYIKFDKNTVINNKVDAYYAIN